MTKLGDPVPGRGAGGPGAARRGAEPSASPTRSPVPPAVLRLSATLRGLQRLPGASEGTGDWQRLAGELKQAFAALPAPLFSSKERRAIEKLLGAPPFTPGPQAPKAPPTPTERERGLAALASALRALPPGRDAALLPERFALAAALLSSAKSPRGGPPLQAVFSTFTEFAARFASLMPPGGAGWAQALPGARQGASSPQRPALTARFLEVLKSMGFDRAVDGATALSALETAAALLAAPSARAVRAMASEVRLGAEAGHQPEASDTGPRSAAPGEPAAEGALPEPPSAFEAGSAAVRDGPAAAPPGGRAATDPASARGAGDRPAPTPEDEEERRRGPRKLGPNFVWNFLHGFRDTDEPGQGGTESLGQVVFAALLVLCGGALIVIVLASL